MKKIQEKIKKHEDAVAFHQRQIERLKERQKLINEMAKRGCNRKLSDFQKILDKEKMIETELKTKTFKPITVNGKMFFVTSNGEVYSKTRKYKCTRFLNGYVFVTINKKDVYVHRLVWETFNGEIPKGMEIDHINTVRTDNRLENLRLVTSSGNKRNPITIEKYKQSNKNKGIVKQRMQKVV